MKTEKSVCLKCGVKQADINGICCKCGWNHSEQRQATVEEMKPIQKKLDDAVVALDRFLSI